MQAATPCDRIGVDRDDSRSAGNRETRCPHAEAAGADDCDHVARTGFEDPHGMVSSTGGAGAVNLAALTTDRLAISGINFRY
jgi:hypothetical protein